MIHDSEGADPRVSLASLFDEKSLVWPLPAGEKTLGAYLLIKTVDKDGDTSWSFRATYEDPNLEELVGALEVQAELAKRAMVRAWESDTD